MNIYAEQIHVLVEKVTRLCQEHDVAMLMAFCLDKEEVGEGRMQMTVAGSTNLGYEIEPPEPMLVAANMLRIPGFKMAYSDPLGDEDAHY